MNGILNPLKKVSKPYNRIKFLWIIIGCTFLVLGALVTIWADIGLDILQKTKPDYFHGKYLNYDNLWLMVSIWTVVFPAFIIIATISLTTHDLPNDSNRENGK